jgi:Ni/Co efflux regulator RcnB
MRHLLISAAVLALTASTAMAQPDHERGRGHEHAGGAPQAAPAPQMQQHEHPAAMRAQAAAPRPEPAHGGPTSFTNQIQGHPLGQERGFGRPAASVMAAQQPAPSPDRGTRSREHGGFAAPVMAAQQPTPQEDRGTWSRGNPNRERGNEQGRPNQAAGFNQPVGPNNNRFASRPGNPTFSAPRRDYSGFRDFHRSFNAQRRFRVSSYRPPAGFRVQRWAFGEFLPRPYWVRDYWLADYALYGLPPPPYGTVWVRVASDALLIDEDSGESITIAYNVFY